MLNFAGKVVSEVQLVQEEGRQTDVVWIFGKWIFIVSERLLQLLSRSTWRDYTGLLKRGNLQLGRTGHLQGAPHSPRKPPVDLFWKPTYFASSAHLLPILPQKQYWSNLQSLDYHHPCRRVTKQTYISFDHVIWVIPDISCQAKVTDFGYSTVGKENISCGKIPVNTLKEKERPCDAPTKRNNNPFAFMSFFISTTHCCQSITWRQANRNALANAHLHHKAFGWQATVSYWIQQGLWLASSLVIFTPSSIPFERVVEDLPPSLTLT